MKNYLLLFASIMLLLFALPKNSSLRAFAQRAAFKTECNYSKRPGKRPCARKCLKHQTHSNQQNNAAGITSDCSQQVYAVVQEQQPAFDYSFKIVRNYVLPHIRKHPSPIIEYDPEPPRLS